MWYIWELVGDINKFLTRYSTLKRTNYLRKIVIYIGHVIIVGISLNLGET